MWKTKALEMDENSIIFSMPYCLIGRKYYLCNPNSETHLKIYQIATHKETKSRVSKG
jgi:hypothetical protein